MIHFYKRKIPKSWEKYQKVRKNTENLGNIPKKLGKIPKS